MVLGEPTRRYSSALRGLLTGMLTIGGALRLSLTGRSTAQAAASCRPFDAAGKCPLAAMKGLEKDPRSSAYRPCRLPSVFGRPAFLTY